MKTLNITFEDKEFKRLQNAKEQALILGEVTSWREYILKLARIKK